MAAETKREKDNEARQASIFARIHAIKLEKGADRESIRIKEEQKRQQENQQ